MAAEFRNSFKQAMSELFLGGNLDDELIDAPASVKQDAGIGTSPTAAAVESSAGTFASEPMAVSDISAGEGSLPDSSSEIGAPEFTGPIPDIEDFAQRGAAIEDQRSTEPPQTKKFSTDGEEAPVFSVDAYGSGSGGDSGSSDVSPDDGAIAPVNGFSRSTIIAEGTEIVGEVKLASNAEIYGILHGNVSSTKNIFTKGEIVGDIVAVNLDMLQAEVRGDVTTLGAVRLSNDSELIGDVAALRLDLRGKLKGNTAVVNEMNVHNTAVLDGNVEAGSIAVGHGAQIDGYLNIGNSEE